MTQFFIKFIIAGTIMGLIDALWLSVIANKFYKSQIGNLLLDKPRLLPAVIFYVIFVIGMVAFAVNPALQKGSWLSAAAYGGLFGLVCYATYDLTNLSTIKGFTNTVVIVDLLWGTLLAASVSTLTYVIARHLFSA